MTDLENEDMIAEYDRIVVRTLEPVDLDAMVRIDAKITGRGRRDYLQLKLDEALRDSRVRVSLGAEVDGSLAGFLMGRLWFGEFGVAEPVATLDTIGVDPHRPRCGIGSALMRQFMTNLRGMGVERLQTQAEWNEWGLLHFLESFGFEPRPRLHLETRIDQR